MNIAVRKTQVARPLKTLVPLIQSDLQRGNSAGREYYIAAGAKLIEAKDQLAQGAFTAWLRKNFDIVPRTAQYYMRWAREDQNRSGASPLPYQSLRQFTGRTERDREDAASRQQQAFRKVMRDLPRDEFVQEKQAREDETKLHRDLAADLIDIGFKALATKLHPDRGGSKDAMSRLNRVRDELRQIAATRRFI